MADPNDEIRARQAAWEAGPLAAELALKGERSDAFTSQAMHWPVSGSTRPRISHAIGFDYLRDVGFPGEYPYTRGTEARTAIAAELWTMAQVTGFGTGGDWAKRGRYMLEQRPLRPDHRVRPAHHERTTTAITRSRRAKWVAQAPRSTRSPTWRPRSICPSTS